MNSYHGVPVPEELQDAWARYQRGEEEESDLRDIDEWRADVNEQIAELHSGEVEPIFGTATRNWIEPKDDFAISFSGEAWETFQRLVKLMPEYGVTVTTQDGEVIEGYLMGGYTYGDEDTEWGDTVAIQPVDFTTEEKTGPVRKVRVGRVEVA